MNIPNCADIYCNTGLREYKLDQNDDMVDYGA